jgi:hypothetical protein
MNCTSRHCKALNIGDQLSRWRAATCTTAMRFNLRCDAHGIGLPSPARGRREGRLCGWPRQCFIFCPTACQSPCFFFYVSQRVANTSRWMRKEEGGLVPSRASASASGRICARLASSHAPSSIMVSSLPHSKGTRAVAFFLKGGVMFFTAGAVTRTDDEFAI